jgi:hypothetical protein
MAAAAAAVMLISVGSARATTYYISSSSGNDSWTGKAASPEGGTGPWKTLTRATTNYIAGDRILLKCGDTWNEVLRFKGSGTPENPIFIGSYGEGNKPVIDRQDYNKDLMGIQLYNQGGIKIVGLEFARCMTGIYAEYAKGSPTNKFLWIEDCYFHDALLYQHYEDYPARKIGLGVCLFSFETANKIVLTDITVKNCVFRRLASGFWLKKATSGSGGSAGSRAGPSGTPSLTTSAGGSSPSTALPGACSSVARTGSLRTANGALWTWVMAAAMARRSTSKATATTWSCATASSTTPTAPASCSAAMPPTGTPTGAFAWRIAC